MRLELLGPTRFWHRKECPVLGPPKQLAVLGVLASRVNEVVGLDRIVDAVWGARAPQTAINGVHTYVAGLRRVLEPGRSHRASGEVLVSAGGGYALRMDADAIDTRLFTRRHAEARAVRDSGDARGALLGYESALDLWRGDAYTNVPGPFAEGERTRLHELRMTAAEEWADVMLAEGRHTEAVAVLSDLVAREPLRERLRWLLMLALHRSGRRAHALALYRETRQLLRTELGIEPDSELSRLHQQILADHPDLMLPQRVTPTRHATPPSTPRFAPADDHGHIVEVLTTPTPAQLPHSVRGFMGRRTEFARLRDIMTEQSPATETDGTVAVIEGLPGVGKTATALRLAHELSDRYPDGQLFVDMCTSSLRREPLDAQRALGLLLGSLGVAKSQLPDGLSARTALYRSLLHSRRVLLVVEDAGAADQIRPLVPRGPAAVLVTSRRRQYGLAARDGAHRVVLGPLEPAESMELLAYLVGEERLMSERESADRLARMCGHLPLALRLAAAGLSMRPHLTPAELVDDRSLGPNLLDKLAVEDDVIANLRAAFSASLRRLPGDAAHMFRLLGLYDRATITVPAAEALSGRDGTWAARQLQTIADHHLLEETSRRCYRFHDLLALYAAECAEQVPAGHRTAALTRLIRAAQTDGTQHGDAVPVPVGASGQGGGVL